MAGTHITCIIVALACSAVFLSQSKQQQHAVKGEISQTACGIVSKRDLQAANSVALEGDQRTANIESEVWLSFDDGVVSKPVHLQNIIWSLTGWTYICRPIMQGLTGCLLMYCHVRAKLDHPVPMHQLRCLSYCIG